MYMPSDNDYLDIIIEAILEYADGNTKIVERIISEIAADEADFGHRVRWELRGELTLMKHKQEITGVKM